MGRRRAVVCNLVENVLQDAFIMGVDFQHRVAGINPRLPDRNVIKSNGN
jgi:hypothetical protein